MKKTHGLVVIALALSLAAGCSKADRGSHAAPAAPPPPPAAAEQAALAVAPGAPTDGKATVDAPLAASRALIVTAEIHMTSKNVGTTTARIRSEVERAGGYVSNATESGSGDAKSATLEVRVPADKTKGFHAALTDMGVITSDVEKVDDVTEARADLKARLQNARVQEKRVLEIMSHKTASLSEVLQAEHELARVRETIERLEAQERSMEGKIALATVKIHVDGVAPAREEEPEAWKTPGKSIAKAFHAGLRGTAALAVYGAMVLAAVSPVLVPAGVLLGITLTLLRGRRRREAELAKLAAPAEAG
jgi:hypothetical protein